MSYRHETPSSVSYHYVCSHTALKIVYFLTTETVKIGKKISIPKTTQDGKKGGIKVQNAMRTSILISNVFPI